MLFAQAASAASATSDIVLIDRSEQAYTVYAGLPAERAETVQNAMAGKPGEVVPFDRFADQAKQYVGERMMRNDYPGERAEEGIVALVRKYPGTPFGLTWNGGIAFTRNDYVAAKKAFEIFQAQGEYSKPPPDRDPVAPMNHLRPLLGW